LAGVNSVTPRAITAAVAPPVDPTALADAEAVAVAETDGLALAAPLADALADALGAAELADDAASAGGFPAAPMA